MNRTTYLVAIPIWALDTLINWDYGKGRYPHLTTAQSKCLNEWIERLGANEYGFICHVPEEHDQPNLPLIPAFGELCESALCYFTIYND